MADLNREALEVWNSLKPMIDKEITDKTQGMVQRRKAKVTTAPSLVTNTIGVTEAFGQEIFLPFVTNIASAKVGDLVWIEWMYGASNAFVSSFAEVDEKDFTVAGTFDVIQRRCLEYLPTTGNGAGWYRVLRTVDAPGEVFKFEICRLGTSSNNETHTIDYHMDYGGKNYFLNETSVSGNLYIDKIRCTYDSSYAYIDIHYNTSTSCKVYIHFSAEGVRDVNANTIALGLAHVSDSPSGETVLSTFAFSENSNAYTSVSLNGKSISAQANTTLHSIVIPDGSTRIEGTANIRLIANITKMMVSFVGCTNIYHNGDYMSLCFNMPVTAGSTYDLTTYLYDSTAASIQSGALYYRFPS